MKLCIFDIKRFALHDGPGIRTTVFFKGCPLECWWCHNPEGIPPGTEVHTESVVMDGVTLEREVEVGRWIEVDDLMQELERDRIYMEESGGGLSFSGGEPLHQANALMELLQYSGKKGFHTTVDTSGYASPAVMDRVAGSANLIYFDLKTLDPVKHKKFTGVSNERILRNLELASNGKAELVIRIPLVSGFNTETGEMESIRDYLKLFRKVRSVDLLPYHSFGSHKYRRFSRENRQEGFSTPDERTTEEIRELFSASGFNVRIGG